MNRFVRKLFLPCIFALHCAIENSKFKIQNFLPAFALIMFLSEGAWAQTCTLPEARIMTSPVYVYDVAADLMTVTMSVGNVGGAALASPFRITVYRDEVGNAKRYTYNYNSVIAVGETANITFGISKFKAEWTPFDTLVIRINDSGNGYNNQPVCDSAYRDYKRVQLVASDDYMLIFNESEENQFRVAINDILPASYVSLTVNLLTDPVCTGTATVSGSTIFYTPATGQSADTLRYRIHCGNAEYADTATVYIKIIDKPENVGDAECFVEPEGTAWSIKELTPIHKNNMIYNYGPFTVGDIDGDGKVEILAFSDASASVGEGEYGSLGIKIFTVENNIVVHKKTYDLTTSSSTGCSTGYATFGSMAIARYNNTGYIVLMGQDRHLYAFNPSGSRLWKSDVIVTKPTSSSHDYSSMLNIADFNGDGIPEVYTGNQIFSLDGGKLLCSGGNNNKGILSPVTYGQYYTVAADMDNDGKLELCAGTQIYKVNIPAEGKDSNGCSMSVIAGMELLGAKLPANAVKDGATQVADIDNDGIPEIIVISLSGSNAVAYVWKPLPGNQSYLMGYYNFTTIEQLYSIPMIGNIDTDIYPEIVFIGTTSIMYALEYDPAGSAGNQIKLQWTLSHHDGSACTGMSLFDFNLDGQNEIVYRDEEQLRIISGNYSGGGPLPATNTLTAFTNVTSGTLREFPIIADVDNDGQAEIIVSGHESGWEPYGYVRVFKTNGSPWAPARKVWNQYAYNAVNVNEDLTIPRVQFNPVTVFPGPDGQLGTSDDIRPYNNFLQQQTTISKNGTPYWDAADYALDGIPGAVYYAVGDSLSISFCVTNYGDVQGTAPFHVSIYKNARQSGNRIVTKSYPNVPAPEQTVCYSLKVENVLKIGDLSTLHLWLNDSGNGTSANPECDYTNGVVVYDVRGDVAAQNDYASLFTCETINIPILANDVFSGTTFTIMNTPKYGTVVQTGGALRYTNGVGTSNLPCEQTGNRIDTVHYKIGSILDSASAYAVVKIYSPPDMTLENACSVNPKIALSSNYDGFTYDWEYSPDGASGWQFVATDSESTKLNFIGEGFYRVTINYDGNRTYRLKKGVEVTVNRTTQLPGGIVWYDLSFNTVNISWQ
jgi:hypothetical protein